MLLLAFDTATPAVTVALHDGTHALAEVTTINARRPSELLAAAIDQVLTRAGASRLDVTAVAAGTGPGPYTGLRAGLVTARVLGSALGVPVHGICTLDVIAADARAAAGGRDFVVATDAQHYEVYWARYDGAGVRLTGPAIDTPAALAAALPASTPVAGAGALRYPGVLGGPGEPGYPAAATLAWLAAHRIAAGLPGLGADPVRLDGPDALPGPDAPPPGLPRPVRVL